MSLKTAHELCDNSGMERNKEATRDAGVLLAYQRHDHTDDILAKFRISRSTLYALLRKYGIDRDRQRRKEHE